MDYDSYVRLPDGRTILHHDKKQCSAYTDGGSCPFHKPSDAVLGSWPFTDAVPVAPGVYVMWRCCPHGKDHPDPDSLAWVVGEARGIMTILGFDEHECDGCCKGSEDREWEAMEASLRGLRDRLG